MKTNPNDPINPIITKDYHNIVGLTKREYFAAMAMQAVMTTHAGEASVQQRANIAVRAADALINELNKPLP